MLIGLSSSVAEILLYRWAKSQHNLGLLAAYVLWAISLTLLGFLFSMEHFSFSAVVVVATMIHLAIGLVWGLGFTESKISTMEIAGLMLAVIAVILLEVGRAKP